MTVRSQTPFTSKDTGFRFDQDAWFERPSLRLIASGAKRQVLVPPGEDQLTRLADALRHGLSKGELAVGAVGFDRRSQIEFTIPEAVSFAGDAPKGWSASLLQTIDTATSRSQIGDSAATDQSQIGDPAATGTAGDQLRIQAFPTPSKYEQHVAATIQRIRSSDLNKVVLARMLVAHASEPFDRHRLLDQLLARENNAMCFALQGFIGASPELIVAKYGGRFRSEPLAGTLSREQGTAEQLQESQKDLSEHAFVSAGVADALSAFASQLNMPEQPVVRETATLLHLATPISGRLNDPQTSVVDLLAALHPTPAIAGTPTQQALEVIRDTEGFDRTLYGGAAGWVDWQGNGEFRLMIRCAEVRGKLATLFAGAGIVAESDPAAELAETDAKFAPMLAALSAC